MTCFANPELTEDLYTVQKQKWIFNNMLYVRYVHLTKVKHIYNRQTHPLVRENAAKGLWPQQLSCKKKSGRDAQGASEC
jgi:hypothetical protein